MKVHGHAAASLVAMTQRLPEPASVILARLRQMDPPAQDTAIEVARLQFPVGHPSSSNGDSVVVIVRGGVAKTAMLRRSWNQPFTPRALRVQEVMSWHHDHSAS